MDHKFDQMLNALLVKKQYIKFDYNTPQIL